MSSPVLSEAFDDTAMPLDHEAALSLEEEDDEFVDAAALARTSSFPSSPSSMATTTSAAAATTAQQEQQQQRPQQQRHNHLRPLLRGLKLGLASSYYSVAELLRLRRLGEIVKVRGSFFEGFSLTNHGEGGGGRKTQPRLFNLIFGRTQNRARVSLPLTRPSGSSASATRTAKEEAEERRPQQQQKLQRQQRKRKKTRATRESSSATTTRALPPPPPRRRAASTRGSPPRRPQTGPLSLG